MNPSDFAVRTAAYAITQIDGAAGFGLLDLIDNLRPVLRVYQFEPVPEIPRGCVVKKNLVGTADIFRPQTLGLPDPQCIDRRGAKRSKALFARDMRSLDTPSLCHVPHGCQPDDHR